MAKRNAATESRRGKGNRNLASLRKQKSAPKAAPPAPTPEAGLAQGGGSPAAPVPITPDMSGMPFEQAFAQARAFGLGQFVWNGAPFSTQVAAEVQDAGRATAAKGAAATQNAGMTPDAASLLRPSSVGSSLAGDPRPDPAQVQRQMGFGPGAGTMVLPGGEQQTPLQPGLRQHETPLDQRGLLGQGFAQLASLIPAQGQGVPAQTPQQLATPQAGAGEQGVAQVMSRLDQMLRQFGF